MKRSELEIGMEVALRRPRQDRERAIILNLEPGWVDVEGPRRPWTAYTEPFGGWGMIRADGKLWGPRFELANHRNNNIAVAREVRVKTGLGYETEHVGWCPDVIPLSQVEQTWATWQATVAAQVKRDAERNAALTTAKDQARAVWNELEPVMVRSSTVAHSIINKLGMDYINPQQATFHQVPKALIEQLARRIAELELQVKEAQEALL